MTVEWICPECSRQIIGRLHHCKKLDRMLNYREAINRTHTALLTHIAEAVERIVDRLEVDG